MTAPHVWHLWPARHWPASAADERTFRASLADLAVGHPDARTAPLRDRRDEAERQRADITAVLNALRCGAPAVDVLTWLPGSRPGDLLDAYDRLAGLLATAVAAWETIVAEQTWEAVHQHGPAAAVLVPVPVHRILTIAAHTNGKSIRTAVTTTASLVQSRTRAVVRIEEQLAARPLPARTAIALGARLHNPASPGLWGTAYYLPARVTTLSPARVADLLGERDDRSAELVD